MGCDGRVLKVEWWYCLTGFFVYLLCRRRMNSADRNDLMPAPAQEKLEWVTPKISLMGAETTDAKNNYQTNEPLKDGKFGPS